MDHPLKVIIYFWLAVYLAGVCIDIIDSLMAAI